MEITEEDAKVIARALAFVATKLAGELGSILEADVSEYIKESARDSYNNDVTAFSKLHIRLAEAFPVLTQPRGAVGVEG